MKFSLLFVLLLVATACSHHKKPSNSCSVVKECLEMAAHLTGKSYIYENFKLDEKVGNTGDVTWTKDNADYLIGELLSASGYYRLPTPTEGTYHLISARDVRYVSNVSSFSATINENDPLPPANSADPVELVYKSLNPGRAEEIARNLRPFLSRYGRVIDVVASNIVILRDTLAAAHQLLPLMRKMDVPLTKADAARNEKRKNEMMRKKTP